MQLEIINLYYIHDLSLGEISDKLKISRQGVYDHLERSEKLLHKYENKLGLAGKFKQYREKIEEVSSNVNKIISSKEEKKEIMKQIESLKNQL